MSAARRRGDDATCKRLCFINFLVGFELFGQMYIDSELDNSNIKNINREQTLIEIQPSGIH